jgi:hypothetical protein
MSWDESVPKFETSRSSGLSWFLSLSLSIQGMPNKPVAEALCRNRLEALLPAVAGQVQLIGSHMSFKNPSWLMIKLII